MLQVIPPKEWYASKNYDMEKIGNMIIDSPIAQLVTGQQGTVLSENFMLCLCKLFPVLLDGKAYLITD